jgi:hypothetical protein
LRAPNHVRILTQQLGVDHASSLPRGASAPPREGSLLGIASARCPSLAA